MKKLFVLDMDGTFYLGNTLFPESLEFVERITSTGAKLVFLTNNSSATPEEYHDKLVRLGVPEGSFSVYTSGEATMRFLKDNYPGSSVYLLATPSVEKMFVDSGIILDEKDPDVVVLTYDKTLTFKKISKFCGFVRDGISYIASHPDINCPTERGFIPDVGSFMALIKTSTGREPDHIVGKPNPTILEMLIEEFDVNRADVIMVGDRLMTDIECGLRAEVTTALVLTGETTREMVPDNPPFIVADNLLDLLKKLGY
ncbi:HAD-IIA family hydrolase [Kosmotoga olearia]|uniref:HAD-superfamily hydrolase, subfamily IIA n=1 Tax=Kosmotoga olearia (strain ATCC BAA-1733 / DSM 21960 / TBF 19.5.1) TaxID=521045 RepID=C5CII3_KOSOT|nr:HAD-IIA family hydrolase [Kosmotoga olearia]ACR79846.1 HAD-superfamily hydrolase, subfamily IIA [Kosmotoga olearia TBF 19.5.1]